MLKNHITKVHKNVRKYIHKGIRNFTCTYCDKSFFGKEPLKKHISKIHLNERNIYCGLCEKSFAEKKELEMQFTSIHDEKKNH